MNGLGKDVLRLVVNSLVAGVLTGVGFYLIVYAVTYPFRPGSTQAHADVAFAIGALIGGGVLSSACVIAGLVILPTARRLKRTFALQDRWPHDPAAVGTAHLNVSDDKFIGKLADAIQRHFSVTTVSPSGVSWGVRLADRLNASRDYSIEVRGLGVSNQVTLVVRRRGWFARVVPVDLEGLQILAGLQIELARDGAVASPLGVASPASLVRDLGPMWRPGATPRVPATRRVRFTKAALIRTSVVVLASVGIFLGTAPLEQSGRISRYVRLIPMLFAIAYLNGEIAFAIQASDKRRDNNKG